MEKINKLQAFLKGAYEALIISSEESTVLPLTVISVMPNKGVNRQIHNAITIKNTLSKKIRR